MNTTSFEWRPKWQNMLLHSLFKSLYWCRSNNGTLKKYFTVELSPHFRLSSPQMMAFILMRYSLKSAFSQQLARSDIALSNTTYSFTLILFAERFVWSHGGFLCTSNFGLKTTPANKFGKGDRVCSIGLYAEYLAAYVDTERDQSSVFERIWSKKTVY